MPDSVQVTAVRPSDAVYVVNYWSISGGTARGDAARRRRPPKPGWYRSGSNNYPLQPDISGDKAEEDNARKRNGTERSGQETWLSIKSAHLVRIAS
jgi:hypothetical protein